MIIFNKIDEIKLYLRKQQNAGQTIGFVPTMGYLHEGHQSLIRKAAEENDITVVSIFVNPTQFGPSEDLAKYPRDLKRDEIKAKEAGAHIIFHPDDKEMYPEGYKTYIEVEELSDVLCGASRKGHFKGVATVVAKLFNIVHPDKAYFGQKDAQQALVIKQMVKDLNMDTEIVVCPIIREEDGLAKSSRNVYLSEDERKRSLVLSKSLRRAQELIEQGITDAKIIRSEIVGMIEKENVIIDYVEIVSADTLKQVDKIEGKILIALAVKVGTTRLIDNIILTKN